MQFIEDTVTQAFSREVCLDEREMNLARAGLLFARAEYPDLDCGWYLGQLDLIAHDIVKRVPENAGHDSRLTALRHYLFEDLGYSGNVDDYYDPRNSYLNEVIDRRIGIPITLSIVFLELADRLGLKAQGLSFPGHFLIGVNNDGEDFIVDAFDGGTMLSRATFIDRLADRATTETSRESMEAALRPASKTEILLRQLRNLKAVYGQQGEIDKILNVLNHMLAVESALMPELLERGRLYDSMGYAQGAAADYAKVLELIPAGTDRTAIETLLRDAQSRGQTLH